MVSAADQICAARFIDNYFSSMCTDVGQAMYPIVNFGKQKRLVK